MSEVLPPVLIVDDERDVCRLLAYNLGTAGFATEQAYTGGDGLMAAARVRPAVIVLDLMLPDQSGIEVCRRLRADRELSDVGVLMLTARGEDEERISGLEAGADDYVVKPFNVREVVLRVQALVRRVGERRQARGAPQAATTLRWRGLEADPVTHEVTLDGHELALRPLEFKLLITLLGNPGRVYTRDELLASVWGIDEPQQVSIRTVDVHVNRLRGKLGTCAEVIETVPGFGYRARAE